MKNTLTFHDRQRHLLRTLSEIAGITITEADQSATYQQHPDQVTYHIEHYTPSGDMLTYETDSFIHLN